MDEVLLWKYLKGETTQKEDIKVLTWLEADEKNMSEYISLRKLYDISVWNMPESIQSPERKTYLKIFREIGKVAAIFLIAFLSVYVFYTLGKEADDTLQYQTVYVPAGQRVELVLSDSTHVWLNARTTFRFPTHFGSNERKVELDGEGYFKVARDTKHPFLVNTQKYSVKVLGTEFNVLAYKGKPFFEVALLKGSVNVFSPDKKETEVLMPEEMVELKEGKLYRNQIEDHNYFRWKEGLICFDNENVEELVKKFELYYDVKIVIQNKSFLKYRYSGKFRIRDGVEHVLRVLQLHHRFDYEKNEEENVIVIK